MSSEPDNGLFWAIFTGGVVATAIGFAAGHEFACRRFLPDYASDPPESIGNYWVRDTETGEQRVYFVDKSLRDGQLFFETRHGETVNVQPRGQFNFAGPLAPPRFQ